MKTKRIRNPRYAPEFLERKLSPSTFTPVPDTQSAVSLVAPVAIAEYDESCDYPNDDTVYGEYYDDPTDNYQVAEDGQLYTDFSTDDSLLTSGPGGPG
jgi:hypothetical protein